MKKIPGTSHASKWLFVAPIILTLNLLFLSCGREKAIDSSAITQSTVKQLSDQDCLRSSTTYTVSAKAETFSPTPIYVPVNGIVKWTDNDPPAGSQLPYAGNQYEVISDNGWFQAPTVSPGQSACLQFTAPGTYPYHCEGSNPIVRGTVIVQ